MLDSTWAGILQYPPAPEYSVGLTELVMRSGEGLGGGECDMLSVALTGGVKGNPSPFRARRRLALPMRPARDPRREVLGRHVPPASALALLRFLG